jgi:twitching motility protein PilT
VPREDPDVVLVGEMRDFHTFEAALTAAETEHRVLATLRTKTPCPEHRPHRGGLPAPPAAGAEAARRCPARGDRPAAPGAQGRRRPSAGGGDAGGQCRRPEPHPREQTYPIQSVLQTGTPSGMTTMEPALAALVDAAAASFPPRVPMEPPASTPARGPGSWAGASPRAGAW